MQKKLKKRLPSLTIAIPAYNEDDNLEWILKNTLLDAAKYLSDFEIIVVNDGSTDNTGKIADRFAKKDKRIRVFHQKNGGLGAAMLKGIKEAKKEFVAYMPADGQFLIRDMQFCLPYMKETDLILGARGSRADYSAYRLILSFGYLILLKILFEINFQDVNWLNIWRTKKVQKQKIESRGIFLFAEIVIRFQIERHKIAEAPSFYRPRREGEVKNDKLSVAFRTFIDALSFWLKLKIGKNRNK